MEGGTETIENAGDNKAPEVEPKLDLIGEDGEKGDEEKPELAEGEEGEDGEKGDGEEENLVLSHDAEALKEELDKIVVHPPATPRE